MKSNNAVNRKVIDYLCDNYYKQNSTEKDNLYISSHWQYYSDFFQIQLDEEQKLKKISGIGFGQCKWNSIFHQVMDEICMISYLAQLTGRSEIYRLKRESSPICRLMGLDPTFDVFRQVCSVYLLKKYITAGAITGKPAILVIGDGHGILSALLKNQFPDATIILADLGKTLLVQAFNLQKVYPQLSHTLIFEADKKKGHDFIYCPAEKIDELKSISFNIAVNIASMQEMNTYTIQCYFEILRNSMQAQNIFYCCNRKSKTLFNGEKSEIRNYPWKQEDQVLLDECCPWQKYFVSKKQTRKGPSLFDKRIPFINYYDGKTIHRVVVMKTKKVNKKEVNSEN